MKVLNSQSGEIHKFVVWDSYLGISKKWSFQCCLTMNYKIYSKEENDNYSHV